MLGTVPVFFVLSMIFDDNREELSHVAGEICLLFIALGAIAAFIVFLFLSGFVIIFLALPCLYVVCNWCVNGPPGADDRKRGIPQ